MPESSKNKKINDISKANPLKHAFNNVLAFNSDTAVSLVSLVSLAEHYQLPFYRSVDRLQSVCGLQPLQTLDKDSVNPLFSN